tara:strand:+ start:26656 stop:26958 length:303 start_codon:yes stop_codon:yes gene_type:complete
MAVETRYAVVRKGVEVLLTTDKKHADEYDKMLDIADALTVLIQESGCQLDGQITEELSIYLAKNKSQVLSALAAKKTKAAKPAPQSEQAAKPQALTQDVA